MNHIVFIIPLLTLCFSACRDADEPQADPKEITHADLIGRWRDIDGENPWTYEFTEGGKCSTYGSGDSDPFGDESDYDYDPEFSYYWYLGKMDGESIIILDSPSNPHWNGILQVKLEGEKLVMRAMIQDNDTRRLTVNEHQSVYERLENQE